MQRFPFSLRQVLLFFFFFFVFFPELFGYILFFGGVAYSAHFVFRIVQDGYYRSHLKEMFTRKPSSDISSNLSSNFFATMQDFRFKPFHYIVVIGVVLLFLVIIDGFVSVPAGHIAVIYDRGQGVLDETLPEGLHLKIPFWQVASIMDTRLQAYTMSVAASEGQLYGDDSIESLTKDGQKVYIDITLQYRINGQSAAWIYKNIGTADMYLAKVIRPGARNVIRDIVTGYDSTNLFTQETRQEAQVKMQKQIAALYGKNKIILEEVLLRNIKFSDVYLQAIEDKQVAQQRIQKAEYERQEAEKIKERRIIEAQAEAEAIRLKGETLRANPSVIQYEFVQKMAPNISWGILPDKVVPLLDLQSLNQ